MHQKSFLFFFEVELSCSAFLNVDNMTAWMKQFKGNFQKKKSQRKKTKEKTVAKKNFLEGTKLWQLKSNTHFLLKPKNFIFTLKQSVEHLLPQKTRNWMK